MFTGLIESVGQVTGLRSRDNYLVMTLTSDLAVADIQIGESIACNGVCLTVVTKEKQSFSVEISQETIARIDRSRYQVSQRINLERALQVGARLGGHFVSGHVDCSGTVDTFKPIGQSLELAVSFDTQYDALVIEKGSIAIDGVSLTINQCRAGWLSVNLIPHTVGQTNLNDLTAGKSVNLEFDLIGKYITKMQQAGTKTELTARTILESGW